MKTNINNNKRADKTVYNLVIVDESGSMDLIRKQAWSGINETIGTIQALQKETPAVSQFLTLITFDSTHLKTIFDNKPIGRCRKLRWDEYQPGACTPLYDAIGRGISMVNAHCKEDDNVLVTIITDGLENASREFTLAMVHNLIAKLKEQHWTFTLIGTDNLDVKGMAQDFAIDNHLAFTEDADGTDEMFEKERRSRRRYNDCIAMNCEMPKGDYFKE